MLKKKTDFEANFRAINMFLDENLHDFEIICPIRGVSSTPCTLSVWAHKPTMIACFFEYYTQYTLYSTHRLAG